MQEENYNLLHIPKAPQKEKKSNNVFRRMITKITSSGHWRLELESG
jgi:hypothetical protein